MDKTADSSGNFTDRKADSSGNFPDKIADSSGGFSDSSGKLPDNTADSSGNVPDGGSSQELPINITHVIPYKANFCFDRTLGVYILIDTGASVSLIPEKLCKATAKAPQLEISGVTGEPIRVVGTHTCTLDIGFNDTNPHMFLVVDIDLDYIIVGLDYMSPRQLYPIPYLNSLTQGNSGVTIGLVEFPQQTSEIFKSDIKKKRLSLEEQVVAQKDESKQVSSTEAINKCRELLEKFPELTCEPDYTTPPKHSHVLDIELFSYETVRHRPRSCSQVDQEAIDSNFEQLTRKGAVVKGSSSFVSPICIARKKDGRPRICVDYSRLNKQTVILNYTIPLIQSLPEKLSDVHQWFTVLDLREAYYSLPLTPRASQLAGIITKNACYRPLRTPFGLTNAPAKFCELVAEMVSGLEHCVFTYMDDMIIYSKSFEEHLTHLRSLLERLSQYGMYLNEQKCVFARKKVIFLGHEVSRNGIRPLTDKVEAVCNMQAPSTLTELRRFLGSLNYYRIFLPEAAVVLAPLNRLLEGPKRPKNAKLEWGTEQQNAFHAAILLLKNAATLAHEDSSMPLVLSTDASLNHAGAVLEQYVSTDSQDTRPLAYYSKAFPKSVAIRSTFNRELTALYQAMRYFKDRLRGRRVVVRTDHASLIQAISNGQGQHSPMEERMIQYITEYNPEIIHVKGALNQLADLLSRPFGLTKSSASSPLQGSSTELIKGSKQPTGSRWPLSLITNKHALIRATHTPSALVRATHTPSALVRATNDPTSSIKLLESSEPTSLIKLSKSSVPIDLHQSSLPSDTTTLTVQPQKALQCNIEGKKLKSISLQINAVKSSEQENSSLDGNEPLTLELIAAWQKLEPGFLEEIEQSGETSAINLEISQRKVEDESDISVLGVAAPDSDHFRPIIPTSLRALTYSTLLNNIHQGQDKSVDLISTFYYWPKMASQIKEWVKACPKCQANKVTRHNRQVLRNYPVNTQRFHTMHIDIVGPLPESNGFKYILTMRDRATGFVIAAPMSDKSSNTVIMNLMHHLIGKFSVPSVVISDQGREFNSFLFEEFCAKMGINHKATTAYHPQSNGAIERIHRILKTSLRSLEDPSDWAFNLPVTILTLNNLTSDTNPFTPHQHTYGQAGRLPGTFLFPDVFNGKCHPLVSDTYAFLENMRHHVRTSRPLRDNNSFLEKTLFTTDKVWVRNDSRKTSLDSVYTGPYKVIARQEKYFTVLLEKGLTNVSVDRLKVAYETPSNFSEDENFEDNGEMESEFFSDNDGNRRYPKREGRRPPVRFGESAL